MLLCHLLHFLTKPAAVAMGCYREEEEEVGNLWSGEVEGEVVEEEEVEAPHHHLHLYLCWVQMAQVEVGIPQSYFGQMAVGEEPGCRRRGEGALMSVLVEAVAEDHLCQWGEEGVACLLSGEAPEGSSFLVGKDPGLGARVRCGLGKEEDGERILEQGAVDRVCRVEVVGVQKLGGNNTK